MGSGCYDSTAYPAAVAAARTAFDIAERHGFRLSLLDIGGGFPGQSSAKISFEEVCNVGILIYSPKRSGYFRRR